MAGGDYDEACEGVRAVAGFHQNEAVPVHSNRQCARPYELDHEETFPLA